MQLTSDGFGAGGAEVTQRPPLTIAWGEQAGRSSRSRIAVLVILALMASMLVVGTAIARPVAALAADCGPANFWVNGSAGGNAIREYQPDGTLVSEIPTTEFYGDIAWTADGQELWAVPFATPAASLERIDPSTGAVLETRPISFPDPQQESWNNYPVTNGTNGLSPYIHPTLGAGFLLGSYSSTRIYFLSQSGPANAVVWSNWPTDDGLRIVSAGDFITLDDGTIAALGADRADSSTPSSGSYLVRIQPDGSSPTIVGTLPLAFGAAKSAGDLLLAFGSGGAVTKVAESSIPTGESTAPLSMTPVVTDPSSYWSGATSKQDAGECKPDVPAYTVEKSSNPASGSTVQPGSSVTYTVTVRNTGNVAYTAGAPATFQDDLAGVLDNATITAGPTASAGTAGISGSTLTWSGPLALGGTATVSYTVQINPNVAPGAVLHNVVTPTGPDGTCVPGSCETDHPITPTPAPAFTVAKSSNPASGTTVVAGQEVTYTLTFANTGEAAGAVDYTDHLNGVLDDADLVSGPTSSDAALAADQETRDEGEFVHIYGTLAPGDSVTVSYTVRVKADGQRGDNLLGNVLAETTNTEPECGEDGVSCTENPIPLLNVTKSSNPVSGSTVVTGQDVTYTLTFANSGQGAGAIDYTDRLADVLDDATLVSGPTASDAALTAATGADQTLHITGALAGGQTVTVSYTVRVNAEDARGNNILGNVLAKTTNTEPECGEDGVSCTENPIPLLESWKAVEADSTPVAAGTVLTYTLFFENSGEAPATVNEIDDLTGVTDDADVTTEPTSTDGLTVSRAGNIISITGEVPAGETYSVTYRVTVKADADRGDDIAANFLLAPGEEPPATCQPTDAQRPDCTVTSIGRLLTSKAVSADSDPVEAGTKLTYTLAFDNQGGGPVTVDHTDVLTDVLDDADVTTNPVASDAALVASAVTGGQFTVTGELAAGQTVTVSYTVTVKADADRGNNSADNFLVPTDEEPPTECVPEDPNCTVTPLPLVGVVKTADPASGSDVQAGQAVTYTLTFSNTGNAAGTVDYTDDLANVLDDADLTVAPVSSDPALTPTSGADGLVRITGTLQQGQTVTVSYTVTVKPDGQRGDNWLRNVVAHTGTENPDCEDTGVSCTEHPIGELDDWKTVDPASGSTLRPGETATYTLHFENTGNAPVAVNRDDVLDRVLDDADVTTQPVSSDAALSASPIAGGRFTVTGELQPGQHVTVSYTVTVKADGQRGDDRLVNFLIPAGETPPEECIPTNGTRAIANRPDCTITHVSDVTVAKSSDPASGSKVGPGQDVTYTLTFTNRGVNPDAADVAVDYTDHMAGVLDDATLTGAPVASDPALTATVAGDTIRITGEIPTGEVVTVTYTVKVKAWAQQGDHRLANVVAVTGSTPVCVPDSPLCTEHTVPPPVPGLAITGGALPIGIASTALLLLITGGILLAIRRRRQNDAASLGDEEDALV